jgi:hypothetical protein
MLAQDAGTVKVGRMVSSTLTLGAGKDIVEFQVIPSSTNKQTRARTGDRRSEWQGTH